MLNAGGERRDAIQLDPRLIRILHPNASRARHVACLAQLSGTATSIRNQVFTAMDDDYYSLQSILADNHVSWERFRALRRFLRPETVMYFHPGRARFGLP